ncbi:MAG: hypothetical protein WAX69_13065 [Victivallales bacterium]
MSKSINIILLVSGFIFCALNAHADEEASNSLYIIANNAWYAKSIPAEDYGTAGKTLVYLASPDKDTLQYAYNWYSPRMLCLMQWAWGVSVVRFGPWHRGSKASKDDFEMAFYNGDKLLAEYSSLDIAESPDNVSESISHYTVIKNVFGYRWIDSNDYVFEIERVDGKILSFDIETGKIKNPTVVIEIKDQIQGLDNLIIPPNGTERLDVDLIYGKPREIMEANVKGSSAGNLMHRYELLRPEGANEFRAYLYVTYREGKVLKAGINHNCVDKNHPVYAVGSPDEKLQKKAIEAEQRFVLEDLYEICKIFGKKLKNAPWNKKRP